VQALLNELSRRKKQAIAVFMDTLMLPFCLWIAFALRLGELSPEVLSFWPTFIVCVCVAIPLFGRLGLYRQVVRYMGNHAIRVMIVGCFLTTLAVAGMAFYEISIRAPQDPIFPRSVPPIFFLLALLYVTGSRFAVRTYIQYLNEVRSREPVIIYGAGIEGVELARLLKQQEAYQPIAFVDENKKLQKRNIDDIYVYPPKALDKLLGDSKVKQIFVAISGEVEVRRKVLEFLEKFSVRVRLIPDIRELVEGNESLDNLRDVGIEDLMGRDEVEPMPRLLSESVANKNVLVTGAGGSIGSELCRQILLQKPRLLVLIEQSEFGLYQVHRELEALSEQSETPIPVVPVLGSVLDTALLARTFKRYRIDTIYHAAAYKHVSLVENNVIQGIKNNTFGTLYCAQTAMDCGVSNFILISTDKAVRTTSVMGASKRLAELILQALHDESDSTQFSMVRFGNVLGSSGSVVPLFTEQIDKGGPVTVTHPDVTRYFMSIPEAAQLVLQAASLGQGGDVFLLDMGQPVRILDLAHRMIRLKGLSVKDSRHPEGDIEIHFTGLKPGEKLHEELLVTGNVTGTDHRKIMRAEEHYLPWKELRGSLNTLEQACETFDYEAIKTFIEGLIEGADLESQLGDLLTPEAGNVVELKRTD
jgi:FlaA1/EpsC-like NDP-sugar epimerase